MLGQCRAANLLLHIRLCMASAQLALCPHGTHVADLLPIARSASGSASPSAPSEQPQCAVTSTEELTYFDEPLELELSLTSVPRPAAADADPNTHPKADPRPHSLADLADVGANVQQQVDRSLEQISTSRSVKDNLYHLVYSSRRARKARASALLPATLLQNPGDIVSDREQEAIQASQAIATAIDSTQEHHIGQLDSVAFAQASKQQERQERRLHAQNKALAALHVLWQQAEPPTTLRGHELELVGSYDAVLRMCGQFKQFLHQEQQLSQQQQQQPAAEQPTAELQGPSSKTRDRRQATTPAITNTVTSAGTSGHPVEGSPQLVADTGVRQKLESWDQMRASVLNELKVKELKQIFELAGWPLPKGKKSKAGVKKPEYIQALLERERDIVEILWAPRKEAAAR